MALAAPSMRAQGSEDGDALLEPLLFAPEQELPMEEDVEAQLALVHAAAAAAPPKSMGQIVKYIMHPSQGSAPGQMPLLDLLGPEVSMALRATCKDFQKVVEEHPWRDGKVEIMFTNIENWVACCPKSLVVTIDGDGDNVPPQWAGMGKGGKGLGGGHDTYIQDEDVGLLLPCNRLMELTILRGCDLTARSLGFLGQLAGLKALTLDDLQNASITTLAPLRELTALRLMHCDLRELKPDWASDLPYLRFLQLHNVELTTPRSHLLARHEHLVDVSWTLVDIAGQYTLADGTIMVDAEENILKGLKVRKLTTDFQWCSLVDFASMPLEELELRFVPDDLQMVPLDFSKMRGLKRLAIYNDDHEGNIVHLGNIIGGDNKLAPLSLTHLFIAVVNAKDDMDFFRSLPRTLKTIGWSSWDLFGEMCEIYKEEDSPFVCAPKDIEEFFLSRRFSGEMGVGRHYGRPIDLSDLLGTSPAEDLEWDSPTTMGVFHKFLGCTQPWAL